MPGGQDLTKLLKKNPGTDARNLIEPSVDVRYLAMKVRAGQTKNIFELLETDDSKLLYLDKAGRYLVYKPASNFGEVFIIKQGDETLINDAIAEVSAAGHVSLFFPPGVWTCPNAINPNSSFVKLFGAGVEHTQLKYEPAAPTATSFFNTAKGFSFIENMSITDHANLTGSLIKIDKQGCEIRRCFLNLVGAAIGIEISDDYNKVIDSEIIIDGTGIELNGQSTIQIIKGNKFDGLSGGSSKGLFIDPAVTARLNIEDNWFYDIDTAIEVANLDTLLNSKIEGNHSSAATKHINHIGTVADTYLVHGNVFTGAGAFTIPAGVKQRDNIGLADAG